MDAGCRWYDEPELGSEIGLCWELTTGPCGVDYTGRAVESEHAALIVVAGRPHDDGNLCTAEGYPRQVTLRLDRALGGRAVLEAVEGMPVPVDLAK
ncbi:hypothetical protein Sru01_61480 [Sphaerisporangium rufum]|uniref:Uncharacterized protein n=1 Tax=Sphaerisporangium rufum TaxID=1381558 RepID=A0A919RA11_9ACTN|nr:hypothetical protein [Sphaerisporangium rufum]GII81166.1 hypothetical protein Sru01_61480 [Sphaerisporangium rufum]